MKNKLLTTVVGLLLLGAWSSCYTTGEMSDAKGDGVPRQLIDLIRNQSGVEVRGGGPDYLVLVRGAKSITGDNNPLYVVDGVQVGRKYSDAASSVDVFLIENVLVLPPPRTGKYGSRGQNGVIEITTKKTNMKPS